MKEENRTLLTLEERLRMAAKSQASSPEAAARMVQRLCKTHTVNFFCEQANLHSMQGWLGEFMDQMGEELFGYGGFCDCFRMAIGRNSRLSGAPSQAIALLEYLSPFEPIWGFQVNNALVLLGLMLLDHAKGRMRDKDIYHCMRMTLRQYLDALMDVSFREDGTLDQGRREYYRIWRDVFLKDYDGSGSLGEALAAILRRYIVGWREFGCLDHILRRIESAVGNDIDPTYGYPEDVPDPGSDDIAKGALYGRILLAGRDYRPGSLREQGMKAPSQDLRELLEEHICEERLALAMREINIAVSDLYVLCAEPYLRMREYHYEKHLE